MIAWNTRERRDRAGRSSVGEDQCNHCYFCSHRSAPASMYALSCRNRIIQRHRAEQLGQGWPASGQRCRPAVGRRLLTESLAAGAPMRSNGNTVPQAGYIQAAFVRYHPQLARRMSRSFTPTVQSPSRSARQSVQSSHGPQSPRRISRSFTPTIPSPSKSPRMTGPT